MESIIAHTLGPRYDAARVNPITDVHGGGEHYKVLESKPFGEGCVVLELESLANDQFRVIEKSFPAGYQVGRSARRFL